MVDLSSINGQGHGQLAIHLMPHPVAAKRFVEPLVQRMAADGWEVELWIEDVHGLEVFAQSIGVPMRAKRYSLRGNVLQLAAGVWELWRSLRALKPRLIEAHQTRDAPLPLLASWLAGVPLRIYHNHGLPYIGYSGPLRALLKAIEWANCRLATHVITVSDGMREAMVRDHIATAAKCAVLGAGSACGLDLAEFSLEHFPSGKAEAKQALGLPQEAFLALFVGRPERRKGAHRLLAVWARNMADGDALWLAGVTADEARIISPGHPDNIRALGYVGDLRPYYAAADVVVLPSEHEGFGYALLEGAALGCCLVASRIPGPDTIVSDGINGFLVAVDDDDGLADVLRRLRDDVALCRTLGGNARRSALPFDRARILDAYSEYLSGLIGQE